METLLALILSFGAGFWDAAPIERTSSTVEVIWVEGLVSIENKSEKNRIPRPGDILSPDDTLVLDKVESITLVTSDLFLITLNGPGGTNVSSLLESDLSANYPRLARGWERVISGYWPDLSITPTPRKKPSSLIIQSPRATSITRTRPWIDWKAINPIVSIDLRLEILMANGMFEEVEYWTNIRTQRFEFSQPLRRGRFYRIVATNELQRDTTSLYVLSEDELDLVSKAEKKFEQTLDSLTLQSPIERVLRARWLDEHGFADRAAELWSALEKAFPTVSHFKKESQRHQTRELATPNGLLSLRGTTEWLIGLAPIFLPIR